MSTFTTDIEIHKADPAVMYEGTEASAIQCEDREVAGVLYRVQNATFNGTSWQRIATGNSYAKSYNSDGTISCLVRYASDTSPWPTSQWKGDGQRGVFNVMDFGAKGDGVTDDTSSITNAIGAIPSTGGVLYLPAGNYLISSTLLISNNTLVMGDGFEFTTLTATNTFSGISGSNAMIANTSWNDSTGTIQQYNIFVKGITVNGSAPANTSGGKGLITLHEVQNCGVSECQVINSVGNGIQVSCQGNTSGTWPGPNVNYQITNNIINLNKQANISSGFSIRCLGASFGVIAGNLIGDQADPINASFNDSIGPAGCSNMVIANNNIFNGGDGINSMCCDDVTITGNVIQNCHGDGIATFQQPSSSVAVSRIIITGNVIDSPLKAGIVVVDTGVSGQHAHDYVVSNNIVSGSSMNPNGIHIQAYNGVVSGNVVDLQGSNYVGVALDGSYCQCSGNHVWNGGSSSTGISVGAAGGVTGCSVQDNLIEITSPGTPLNPNLSNLTACAIKNNVGFNPPSPTSITQPTVASGLTTNPFPYDCTVYVVPDVSGTHKVSEIDVNGLAVINSTLFPSGLVTPLSVRVPANGTISLTYTGSPKWVWIPE